MKASTPRAASPEMRKVGAPTPTLANYINNSSAESSSNQLRLQFLTANLSMKEGEFVGRMAFSDTMMEKQSRWFSILLARHGLAAVGEGEHHG